MEDQYEFSALQLFHPQLFYLEKNFYIIYVSGSALQKKGK